MPTKIAWADESWNPVTGCTPVSEGCAHCYAKKMTERFGGDFSKVTLHPDRLEIPLHWRKPRRVFVGSMGDLFHEDVPDAFILDVFNTMMLAEQHTFQVLTKRPERMREWCNTWGHDLLRAGPLPNVWLMVSAEHQKAADERVPILLETPAAVRGVSAEPLLGPIDLTGNRWEDAEHCYLNEPMHGEGGLDWVIVGGESGGPPERRLVERCDNWRHGGEAGGPHTTACTGWGPKPEALGWVRDIRDQCQAAGVPFFFKQWGPKAGQGTEVDGREWREMPEVRA